MNVRVVRLLCCLCLVGIADVTSAALIDFEAPTYTTGELNGQDGWAFTSYAGDPGTVVVDSGALAGAQSVSSSGAGISRDVYRDMEAYTDGPGIDFYTSLLWRQMDGGTSVFAISSNALNGASPILLRIDGSNIQYAGLAIPPYFTNFSNGAGAYTQGNTFEFSIGVDIGAANYSVSWRDVTANGAFTAPETVAMWSLAAVADRPTSGVVNGVTMGPRSDGAVTYDNIKMTAAVPEPSSIMLVLLGVAGMMVSRRRGRA